MYGIAVGTFSPSSLKLANAFGTPVSSLLIGDPKAPNLRSGIQARCYVLSRSFCSVWNSVVDQSHEGCSLE